MCEILFDYSQLCLRRNGSLSTQPFGFDLRALLDLMLFMFWFG